MINRRLTLIVVSEGRASARRYGVPRIALGMLLAVVVGLFYGIGAFVYQKEIIRRQSQQVQSIAEENAHLKRQNSRLSEEAVRLSQRVQDIAERTQKFQTVLGFDDRLDAVGGVGGPTDVTLGRLGLDDGFTGRLRPEDLDGLDIETRGVDADLRHVEETFRERSELLAAVPSISPVQGSVTSGFGYRFDPFTGVRTFHPALDISNPRGAPVMVTADGVVTAAGYEAGYGLAVEVMHGYGFSTRYGHMQGIKVKVGQRVRKGEIIGVVGSTGRSTGYHLHYEVRVKDEPVDPSSYMVELTQQANFAARMEKSLVSDVRASRRAGVNNSKGAGGEN